MDRQVLFSNHQEKTSAQREWDQPLGARSTAPCVLHTLIKANINKNQTSFEKTAKESSGVIPKHPLKDQ
jgi:hypothetical protein